MTELKNRLLEFLREKPKQAKLIGAGVCLGLAAVVLIIALAVGSQPDPVSDSSGTPSVAPSTEWPDSELLEGIARPQDGRIVAVSVTERSVAVFVEAFPPEALREYLDSTGLTFEGTAPYVAKSDGRTVAVEYSATEEKLSVTVVQGQVGT